MACITLFFKEKMLRRLAATQALELLQDILSDCSDGKQSDDDMNDVEGSTSNLIR